MESIELDSKLEAGYYDCDIEILEHTFSRVSRDDGPTVWFDCYGGYKRKKGRVFPAELAKPIYSKKKCWTGHHSVHVSLALARGICCGDPFDERLVYNDKSTDDSGLAYGTMGVCHQMCNRIMMAARRKAESWIVRPPSFVVSYFLYGYWGGGHHPDGLGSSIDGRYGWSAMKRVKKIEKMLEAKSLSERESLRASLQDDLRAELQSYMEHGYSPEARRPIVEEMLMPFIEEAPGVAENSDFSIDDIMKLDGELHGIKEETDRQLLAGEIATGKYAETVNGALKEFFVSLRDHLGQEKFKAAFGFDPDAEGAGAVIAVEQMPEQSYYEDLGDQLR